MAVQRRGAAQDTAKDEPDPQEARVAPQQQPTPAGVPAVAPRVAINIGVHSLLMLVLPLGLFFASSSGLLDRECRSHPCCVPDHAADWRRQPAAAPSTATLAHARPPDAGAPAPAATLSHSVFVPPCRLPANSRNAPAPAAPRSCVRADVWHPSGREQNAHRRRARRHRRQRGAQPRHERAPRKAPAAASRRTPPADCRSPQVAGLCALLPMPPLRCEAQRAWWIPHTQAPPPAPPPAGPCFKQVIASFVISAFNEPVPAAPAKED